MGAISSRHSKSKYKNIPVVVNGKRFPSKKEANRFLILLSLQAKGEIFKLQTQVTIKIIVNGLHVCSYRADFVYYNKEGKKIIEDVKGYKTAIYKLKCKLLHAANGINVLET